MGGPSPAKKKITDQETTSGRAIQTAGDVVASPGPHGCRPWDRGDLFRRLATYKSTTWFGKPQVGYGDIQGSHIINHLSSLYPFTSCMSWSVTCTLVDYHLTSELLS